MIWPMAALIWLGTYWSLLLAIVIGALGIAAAFKFAPPPGKRKNSSDKGGTR